MNIKVPFEWFIDAGNRRSAEKELAQMKKTDAGRRPAGSDRKHYKAAQAKLDDAKRHTLERLGGLLGVILAAGTTGGLLLKREESEENPAQNFQPNLGPISPEEDFAKKINNALRDPDGSVEKTTDEVIRKVEQGMSNLWEKLKPAIAKIPPGHFREQLELPFIISQINEANPEKNAVTFQRRGRQERKDIDYLGNDNYFTYLALGNMPPGFAAGFEPPGRMLNVSANFNPDNPVHLLILYHELRHVAQDAARRQNMGKAPTSDAGKKMFEDYIRFHTVAAGGRPRTIINEEATAYAFEMEIFNLLTGGRLKELSEQPDVRLTVGEGLAWINAAQTQENLNAMGIILQMGLNYFPDGLSKGGLTVDFSDKLAEYLEKVSGYEIFEHVPGRGVFPYRYGAARSPDTAEQPAFGFY